MARPKAKRGRVPSQEMVDRAMAKMRAKFQGTDEGEVQVGSGEDPVAELLGWIEKDGEKRPGRDEFITYSSDDRGEQSGMKVNFSTGIYTIMEQIVQQGLVPAYRSKQDIVRDAIVHRLWDIVEGVALDGPALETLRAETIDKEIRNAKDRMDRNNALIAHARDQLKMLEGSPEFWRVLERVRAQALGLSEPWRGELLGIIAKHES